MVCADDEVACSVPCLPPSTWLSALLTDEAITPWLVCTPAASGAASPINCDSPACTSPWIWA